MGDEDITAHDLIQYALNCYSIRVTNTSNPWMHNSKEHFEFEAPTATVKGLRDNKSKLGKALKSKIVTRNTNGNKKNLPTSREDPTPGNGIGRM